MKDSFLRRCAQSVFYCVLEMHYFHVMGLFLQSCACETIDGSHCNFAISKEESPPDSPGEDSPITVREACWCKVVWFGFTQKCLNGSKAVHSGLQQACLATEIRSVLPMQGQNEPSEPKPAMDEDQKNNFFCKGFLEPRCFR